MATQVFSFICSICGKSVDMTSCKADEFGNAVHGPCYAAKLSRESDARKGSIVSQDLQLKAVAITKTVETL